MTDYLKGKDAALMIAGLSSATFMQVLDSTIANVALPAIAGNLGASVSQGIWVLTFFMVFNAASIPLTGFLAKRIGEVRLFSISSTLFIIASLVCGLSTSLVMLIIARIFQGLVSGPMIPLAQSLLLRNTPLERRSMAMGLFGIVIMIAPVLGPILGGYISDNYYWGWIFFINVPIGLLSLVLCWITLRRHETEKESVPVDYVGIVCMMIGVACFQLMLDRGREVDWFQSNEIIILTIISVVCFLYFLVWEIDQPYPLIKLSLLRDRNFSIGTFVLCASMMVYVGAIVLIPQVLESQYGYQAITAGESIAVVGFFPFILTPIVGKLDKRVDMRIWVTISFLVFAFCFYWRSNFNIDMTFWDVCAPQFVQGIAVAFYFMPINNIIFSRIKPTDMAQASGLSNFLRTLFGGIGASLSMTVWERREAVHHAHLTESFHLFNANSVDWMNHIAATLGIPKEASLAVAQQMITQQGFIISSNEIFYVCALVFLFLTGFIWLSKRI